MQTNILKYSFNGQDIDFNFTQGNVMVNATQMAKLFDGKVTHFLDNQQTKNFIEVCLKSRNSDYLNVKNIEDLYTSTQKTGTFMHRVLALKFAAWLDPEFELWVFSTIDQIIFGNLKMLEESLSESANRKNEIDQLEEELSDNPAFLKLETLRLNERQAAYSRSKISKSYLQNLRQTRMELE